MLVVTQLALSLPLLAGAGLLARTLHNLQSVEVGFPKELICSSCVWMLRRLVTRSLAAKMLLRRMLDEVRQLTRHYRRHLFEQWRLQRRRHRATATDVDGSGK